MKKNVQTILADIREKFRAAGIDTPDLDARLLVEAATGLRHDELLLNNSRIVTETEADKLLQFTARRLKHEPVSRILGRRGFWKHDFKISRETLDPRADSETIVEAVLAYADKGKKLNIIDLGTGSGCLLLSVLGDLPNAKGLGIDISADAVKTAKDNAKNLGLTTQSKFMEINWRKDTIPGAPYDIVISNPPYIAEQEMAGLAPEVTQYDPIQALVGGVDGLDCYREITTMLPQLLTKEGRVFFEIGATQAKEVEEILAKAGLRVLHILQDLSGHNRCVVATWA